MHGRAGSFNRFVLWFGAAVSAAELLTGGLLAPLGFQKGLLAALAGHFIGGLLLYWTGLIGARSRRTAAEAASISFGRFGSRLFSILNVLQLVGWTAVMIRTASDSLHMAFIQIGGHGWKAGWTVLLAILIIVWIVLGGRAGSVIQYAAAGALLICSFILAAEVFTYTDRPSEMGGSLSFGAGVELNVSMAVSWLPLIADYTRNVKDPQKGTFFSVLGYISGSMMMFVIGLGAALYAGTEDPAILLLTSGMGLLAVFLVLFSTVTTAFLDAFSAGVSLQYLWPKLNAKAAAGAVCLIGSIISMLFPISAYEHFLYAIGSVFAPMFAVLLTDYFLLRRSLRRLKKNVLVNLVIWAAGTVVYQLLPVETLAGITVPIMAGISLICILIKGGMINVSNHYEQHS